MTWTARLIVGAAVVTATLLALAAYAVTQVPVAVRGEAWLEVARAAIQAIAIGIIGGFLAYLFRQHELERERRSLLNQVRLRLLLDVVAAYNRTKAVRRVLRAAGFPSPANETLTASQIDDFHSAMRVLNDAQLELERIKRELRTGAGQFAHAVQLVADVGAVERYLGEIVSEWEDQGPLIRAGDIGALKASQTLHGFLATHEDPRATFTRFAVVPLESIEGCIRAEMGFDAALEDLVA